MPARLRSDIQISGLKRLVEGEGMILTVLAKGHEEGGMIFVKWVEDRRAMVFTERAVGEQRRWVRRTAEAVEEAEADAIIASERDFDPDLWAVEVMGGFAAAERLLSPLPGDA